MSNDKQRKPRLSLTKAQIQAGLGAELLSLCQTITEDGSLSEQEISALRKWLADNRSTDLPSIDFLSKIVEQIIADGKVTKDELRELYKAIELILPPEVRKGAAIRRRVAESQERDRIRAEGEAEKEREREERERNRPLASANFMVAGVSYEDRADIVRQYVNVDDTVYLVRDRENKFSRNAIEIRTKEGYQIGFVPEDDAVYLASLLDKGNPHSAFVTKILTGRRCPIPVVQAYVFGPDATESDLILESQVPQKKSVVASHQFGPGCTSFLLLAILLLILWLFWWWPR